ncbi:protein-S-isoprenylcysteine O-methyltransferase Ste14 [Eilatimonas milleporae]|uniref:Protein-S-isoprenylcysteine O-methyltransferase Ste14 n=2 Tax=Eilatimonas milleporae TaxID=911205 RepID=A0A3M0CGF7_9PROT|nr:protein-S-isoprenylcysteine O-methyltransferase Ste14 [Eilatimonas milleporae]
MGRVSFAVNMILTLISVLITILISAATVHTGRPWGDAAMKTAIRLFATAILLGVLGVIVWRLPVNGWGSLVWVASIVLLTVLRMPHARQTKTNTITDKHAVSLERVLLALVAIGGTFVPLIHLATGFFAFANYRLPDWAVIVGAAILVPAYWLFWRSHADLGLNWSVTTELRAQHDLVTSGVYERIRHPMYAAIWLIFLVQPLFIHNWIAGLSGPLAFAVMYFVRVPYEEVMMRERFGEAYDAYCKRSGRLFPR